MNGDFLIFFVILLLGLILCSFLGSREGMENAQIYYGPNGASAIVETDSNGQTTLVVTGEDGLSTTYSASGTDIYVAPNGATATIKTTSNGSKAVQIKDSNGNIVLTLTNNTSTGTSTATTSNGTIVSNDNYDNYNHYNGTSTPTIFYGPNGGTAKVIQTPNNNTIVITNKNGTTEIYYIDNAAADPNVSTYYGPNGGSAKMITDSNGKKAVEITTPSGSKVVYTGDNVYTYNSQDDTINQYDAHNNTTGADVSASTFYGPYGGQATTVTGPAGNTVATYDSSSYYNSLPTGIPRSQIPSGDEDLYILKSQIVPPVCPKCPNPIMQCPDKFDVTKCPACPPCGRCSEPAFECKKVPNYNAFNPDYMPVPVISDFSGFGM
jgi:hypothetical protein